MKCIKRDFLQGRWRSYKSFNPSGTIGLCTSFRFQEVTFAWDGTFQMLRRRGNLIDNVVNTNEWQLKYIKNKIYLKVELPGRMYEVISLEENVLVLEDFDSKVKTFYIKCEC